MKRAPKLWFTMLSNHLKAMGLRSSATSPCLFMGTPLPGEPPIYVGIYVDDIIERKFEDLLSAIGSVDFVCQVSLFLGIDFTWTHHEDGHITVHLTQQSFAETLIESLGFESFGRSVFLSPYRSGLSIDSIVHESMDPNDRDALCLAYQSLAGSLIWLAHTMWPDLVVSLLAQHQINPSNGRMEAANYATKYLAHTKDLGIYFNSQKGTTLDSFLHFPLPPYHILSMLDAKWGPQDASQSRTTFELPLFASQSMSAFYIDLLRLVHWLSKRQSVTAGSSVEAEIYATGECVKFLGISGS
jgi:hypothetical protein